MQKKNKIALTLILLLAGTARLFQVEKIFFMDEMYTFKNCSGSLYSLVQYWFSEGHFPAYFIIMRYWAGIFGNAEFIMRLPSLIFGVLSVYVMFVLGKRLFNEKAGFLAGFLLAASTLNIYYSQITRPYSMVTFFVLMSFLFLCAALKKNTARHWIGYISFTLFALLLSASTVPVIICQIVFVGLVWPEYKKTISAKKIIAVFCIIAFIYLPFAARLFFSSFRDNAIAPLIWIDHPSFKTIAGTFSFFGNMRYENANSDMPDIFNAGAFKIALFLLCLKGIFSLFKSTEKGDPAKGICLFLWLIGPIILFFGFSKLVTPVFGPVRYVLYSSPVYYLLIGKGIMSFRKKIRFMLAVFIIIFSLVLLKEYHHAIYRIDKVSSEKENKLYDYMRKNVKVGDTIALSFHNAPHMFDRLFDNVVSLDLNLPVKGVWSDELFKKAAYQDMAVKVITGKGVPEDKKANLNNMLKLIGTTELRKLECDTFWFIDLDSFQDSEMVRLFKDEYDLAEEKNFNDINVYYFRKKGL